MAAIDRGLLALLAVAVLVLPLQGLLGALWTNYTGVETGKLVPSVLSLVAASGLIFRSATAHRRRCGDLWRQPLMGLALGYAVLVTMYTVLSTEALAIRGYGWLLDVRLPLLLMAGVCAGRLTPPPLLRRMQRVFIGIALIVAGVAVVQAVFPGVSAWLHAAGYTAASITVDQTSELRRSSGTLRGPNELGAYMVLSLFCLLGMRNDYSRRQYFMSGGLLLAALIFSYSRSAAAGLGAGLLFLFVVEGYRHWAVISCWLQRHRRRLAFGVLAFAVAGGLLFGLFSSQISHQWSIVVLHDNPTVGPDERSDDVRLRHWQQAIEKAKQSPLGYGVGSAGPASVHSASGGMITENYYLQLLIELGVIGVLGYLALLAVVGCAVMRRDSYLAAAVLALSVASLFLHTMADEAVASTLWLLCGLRLSSKQDSPESAILKA